MFGGTAGRVLEALRPHGLKGHGNSFHGNAVWRGGDSMSISLTLSDDEHGVYYDHARGVGGTLYDLAELLGVERPTGNATKSYLPDGNGRKYSSLEDYARAHGIPENGADIFAAAAWSREVVTHKNRPALRFETAAGARWRFIDGAKPKYDSAVGYRPCWYGLRRALTMIDDGKTPISALVIANGEASVVVAQHYNIPAACVTAGENSINADLVRELNAVWSGPIWVVFDHDAAGRAGAQKLQSLCPRALIVSLWEGPDSGADLADYCSIYRADAPTKLAQVAAQIVPQSSASAQTPPVDVSKLLEAARQIKQAASASPKAEDVIFDAATKIQAQLNALLAKTQTACSLPALSVVGDAYKSFENEFVKPEQEMGLRSPFPELDRRTGGFMPGDLWCILGHTGAGKSWFAASLVGHFSRQNKRGYLITTEMLAAEWAKRIGCYLACLPIDKFIAKRAKQEDLYVIAGALDLFAKTGSFFNDTASPAIEALSLALDAAHKEHPLDYIVIDSAMRLTTSSTVDMVVRHTMVAEWLLSIAKAYNIPVIFTAQAGRNSKDRAEKRPEIWDIMYSSAYEQNATHVLSLFRPGMFDPLLALSPEAEIGILKDRRRGSAGTVIHALSVVNQGWYPTETR